MPEPVRSDWVLVGGGHAHIQVLRRFLMAPLAGVRLTLVTDRAEAVYSGCVPGFVAGDYAASELAIDCVPLARRAGARVLLAEARGLEPDARRLLIVGRPPLAYDAISFDVGSTLRGLDRPGVRAFALKTRPIKDFVATFEARLQQARPEQVVVVGAGAAGVELAFTLEARLRATLGRRPEVTLLGDAPPLSDAAGALQRRARRLLEARGVTVRRGEVASISATALRLVDGSEVPTELVVWATGAAPLPLHKELALPLAADGFLSVRATLQSVAHDNVFAVGDCAAFEGGGGGRRGLKLPKAGVYAVRQGPLLDHNLRALYRGHRLRRYRPQRDFLKLLNLGERRALAGKWSFATAGATAFRLKDAIDRRFIRRFRVLDSDGGDAAGFPSPESMGMKPMDCGGCAAKLEAGGLSRALARLSPAPQDATQLFGLDEPDDAAAFRTQSGDVLLASIDGFRAFSDDPWLVGRVATLNALSDLHATGGHPRHALVWVTAPDETGAEETLYQVMAGVRFELDARGVTLLGGHSSIGPELTVGLSVLGAAPETVSADALPRKGALRPGDALLLSRALGAGVLLAADMQGRAHGHEVAALQAALLRSNHLAARIARAHGVRAMTDISGFGLAVHLGEMLRASELAARLEVARVPTLPGARRLLARGLRSTAHPRNAAAARPLWGDVPDAHPEAALLLDPQTNGGLLMGIAEHKAAALLAELQREGHADATLCGVVETPQPGTPRLRLDRKR